MTKLVTNKEASIFVGTKATFQLGAVDAPKAPFKDPIVTIDTTDFAAWGDNNLLPQTLVSNAEYSTIIKAALEWKTQALYGSGLEYGTLTIDENGKEKFNRILLPEIEQFMKYGGGNLYIRDSILQFYYFYNVFPRLDLTANRQKIAMINYIDCCDARWAPQNKTSGMLEALYISANWKGLSIPNDAFKIRALDPYFNPLQQMLDGKDFTYIFPLSYPKPGKKYYSLVTWHTAIQSKWFDMLKAIPKFKAALMENQATIKYHVKVHNDFWPWKYPNWKNLTEEEQIVIKTKEVDNFDKKVVGNDKAGKSLMTPTNTNPRDMQMMDYFKIEAIDNKIKDGIYIEDSQEAVDHLLFALGIDGTLIGKSPGKGMGAGSGSDKRVAFNMYINNCKMHEDIILEPFYFIAAYNGWKSGTDEIHFRFKRNEITTLDTGASGKPLNIMP